MIVFLGPPGSGKGTQSKLLEKERGYSIFSIGEILRNEVQQQTDLGKQIEANINKGEFASLDIITSLLKRYVVSDKFVLDGFPRNLAQANVLEEFIKEHEDAKQIIVFDFIISTNLLINRLMHRLVCHQCHGSLSESDFGKKCPYCGASTDGAYKRSDDNEEVIKVRLEKFEHETKPLRQYYKEQASAKYISLDAASSSTEVFAEIIKHI